MGKKAQTLIRSLIYNRSKYSALDEKIKAKEDYFNDEMKPLYEKRNMLSDTVNAIANTKINCRISDLISQIEYYKPDYDVTTSGMYESYGTIPTEEFAKHFLASLDAHNNLEFKVSHKDRSHSYLDFSFMTTLPSADDIQPDGRPFSDHIVAKHITLQNGYHKTVLDFDNLDNVLVSLPLNTAKHYGIMDAIANAEYDPQEKEIEK